VGIVLSTLKKILFWSYERGSWQYDIMCVLILAFIFSGPNGLFHNHRSSMADASRADSIFVSREEVGQVDPARLEQEISNHLSQKFGHGVKVSRVNPVWDASGNLEGYVAWEK
jgi:hypothetical protein